MQVAIDGSTTAAADDPARRSLLRIWLEESRCEILKAVRMPAYTLPMLAFPAVFYVMFGIVFGGGQSFGPVPVATYLLATYGTFGVMGVAFFGFGVGLAIERGQGWMLMKRASPMPIWAYFGAKMAMSLLFGVAVVAVLVAIGIGAGGVEPDVAMLLRVTGTALAGSVAFCAIGLMLAYLAGPNSAPAVVNLIYLPMAFLSGMWVPVEALPDVLQRIAAFLPAYHYAQLGLRAVGAGQGKPIAYHVAVLAVFMAAALAIAAWRYRRDEGKTWG
jgi:ABC-2 type transport system permease protein